MEQYASDFNKYFNITLKNYLKFPETYNIHFNPGQVILKADQPAELNAKLTDDLYGKLYQQIVQFIQQRNSKINNINLYLINDLTKIINGNIIIYYETLFMPEEMYLVISSYLLLGDLNTFCNIHQTLCSKDSFWMRMIQERFGWTYPINPKYKWKTIYHGLLLYFLIEEPFLSLKGIPKLFPGTMEYLIQNDLIEPDKLKYILGYLLMEPISLDLAQMLIDKKMLLRADLYDAIAIALNYSDTDLFKVYHQGLLELEEPPDYIKGYLEDIFNDDVLGNPNTTIEMYDLISNLIELAHNDNDIVEIFYLNDTNTKLAQHLIDMIPINTDLNDLTTDLFVDRPNIAMMVLNKFKFPRNILQEMLETFDDFYKMSIQEENEKRLRQKLVELIKDTR